MNIYQFLTVFAVSLGGATIGIYLTRGRRAKNKKLIPDNLLSKENDQNLGTFFAFLAIFTLIGDVNVILGTGWELPLVITDFDFKYGAILGLIAARIGQQYLERRKNEVDVVKNGT